MEKVTFTRLQLYDLVWKTSVGQIAREFGVSTKGIKNACRKMDIPLPGSTQRLRFEFKRDGLPKLPDGYKGSDHIEILKKAYEIQVRSTPKSSTLLERARLIEYNLNTYLAVPHKLDSPVPLIENTLNYWEKKKKGSNNEEDQILDGILYLNVSEENIPRALRLMDTFIKLLEKRGHSFEKGVYGTGKVVFTDGIEIDVYLREALRRIPPMAVKDSSEYVRTGEFILQIGRDLNQAEWRDGKFPLEKMLARITAKLELIHLEEKQWQDACESSRKQKDEENSLKVLFEDQKKQEIVNFKDLLSKAERLEKATCLRRYVQAVEQKAVINNCLDESLQNWIQWASDKIDWFDPLVGKKDDFLSDFDLKQLNDFLYA